MSVLWKKKTSGRGGRWVYDFVALGRRYQGNCVDPDDDSVAETKRQAREIEDKIRQRARQARRAGRDVAAKPGDFLLAQAIALHLQAQTDSSALHVQNLERYSAEILGFFGYDAIVTRITQEKVLEYRAFAARQTVKVYRGGQRKGISRDDVKWWKDTGKQRAVSSTNHHLNCLRGALLAAHRAKDPDTGIPYLPFPPTVEPLREAARLPRPMPDDELSRRQAVALPHTRETAELVRLFGLRKDEALSVTIANVRTEIVKGKPYRYLVLRGEENKGGDDVPVHGAKAGSDFLEALVAQARKRKAQHLITWPGQRKKDDTSAIEWRPLKTVKRNWRTTAKLAAIEHPHRMHDTRARYITEIARIGRDRHTQAAARHKDFKTTLRYIDAAAMEVADIVEIASQQRKVNAPAPATKQERGAVVPLNKTRTESLPRVPSAKNRRSRKIA